MLQNNRTVHFLLSLFLPSSFRWGSRCPSLSRSTSWLYKPTYLQPFCLPLFVLGPEKQAVPTPRAGHARRTGWILVSILALLRPSKAPIQLLSGRASPTRAEASSAFAVAASPSSGCSGSGCAGRAVPSSITADTTCELAASAGSDIF